MKRKIRLSALVAVAVMMLALLIGGLYGYFDDTETSTGNVFTAGTLDLETSVGGASPTGTAFVVTPSDNISGICGHVVFTNAVPGDNGTITWTLVNTGNVDGNLTFNNVAVDEDENLINEPEAESGDTTPLAGELGSAVDVTLERSVDGGAFVSVYSGTLAGLVSFVETPQLLSAGTGHSVVYVLGWSIDGPTVGNEIQSDIATLDITFDLIQA
jgi:predicted ribosomally synthesized peptide with SipW-like signal peptide